MSIDELLRLYRKGQRDFTNDIIIGESLAGQHLPGLRLIQMQLVGVNLENAILDDLVLQHCRLENVTLTGASLQRAKLAELAWQDHSLERVNLTDADLSHAQLQYASLREAILFHADCSSANLRAAQFHGADLRETIFVKTILDEVQADEHTQWSNDVALFRGSHLSPGMTIVKLIGRTTVRGAAERSIPTVLISIPGSKAVAIEKVQQAILYNWHTRVEQAGFRREVLHRYRGRCAISSSEIVDSIDAAHIIPYKVASQLEKGAWTNGFPLRADLHRLFDLGKIEIDPETYIVSLDEDLQRSPSYQQFHQIRIALPNWPSPAWEYEARLQKNLRWRQQYYKECLAGILAEMGGEEG